MQEVRHHDRSLIAAASPEDHEFETPEGLRALLIRLQEAGPGAWRYDTEAHELAKFTAGKYARLARKYGLDRWEAVTAAFEAMRKPGTARADNPWAVVTEAVRLTCIYEQRGQGLLCSVDKARKSEVSANHDAERFADRDQALLEWNPAFQVGEPRIEDAGEEEPSPEVTMIEQAVFLFSRLCWPESTARNVIWYIYEGLERLGSRTSAFDVLRRDRLALALLDVTKDAWNTVVAVLLGTQNPAYAATNAGRGLFMRIVIGESFPELLSDEHLVRQIVESAPKPGGA